MKKNNGFTLVEALVAMAIVIFVVVSILSGFTQQMVTNHFAQSRNVAITLAESMLEDYMKFPALNMKTASVDYAVAEKGGNNIFTVDPQKKNQYRRTATVIPNDLFFNMSTIRVVVDYGYTNEKYPFRVVLTSTRGE